MKLRVTHFYDPEPIEFDDRIDNRIIWHNKGEHDKAHSAWKARQQKPDHKEFRKFIKFDHIISEQTNEYKKALQHYDENRRRYDGFEKMSRSLEKYSDGTLDITFGRNDYVHIKFDFEDSGLLNLEFYRGLSVSLFEQIMYENNIKIKKV